MISPVPIPFWDSPAFTNALVVFLYAIVGWVKWVQSRNSKKLGNIEENTNGINDNLKKTIEKQTKDAADLAVVTEADKQEALKKKGEES